MLSVISLHSALAYDLISIDNYEPVRAEIVNSDPSQFTINVRNLSNIGVDQKAEYFSVYTTSSKPENCADFTNENLPYEKPEKYLRQFNLSDQPEILEAIESVGCVAMKNIPV